MTSRVNGWLDVSWADDWRDLDHDTVRAGDVEREIAADPTSITVRRAGVDLDAQTVRLLQQTWPPRGREAGSAGGEEAEADLVVLGTSSLDIQRGDRFTAESQLYEVIYVAPVQSNRVEAMARQVQ